MVPFKNYIQGLRFGSLDVLEVLAFYKTKVKRSR